MIAFATLLLGLVAGRVPIELVVGPGVARVELRLDGATAGTLRAAPWSATVDLGEELAPHRLTAVAFDAGGRELATAEQWVDLPRPAAELDVAVAAGDGGRTVARFLWAGPAGMAPTALRATLDGAPLAIDPATHSAALPPAATGASALPRLLHAEAEFAGGVRAERDVALGGEVNRVVASELTAVPVEREARRSAALALRAGGAALPVLALDEGAARLVVVLDPGCRDALARLDRQGNRHRVAFAGNTRAGTASTVQIDRTSVPLPRDATLRMVWPIAEARRDADVRFDLFPTSPARDATQGPLLAQLQLAGALPSAAAPARLADAVALAALAAADGGERRAVVLVLGPAPADASAFPAPVVRRYLQRLRVPLLVWSVAAPDAAVREAWGAVEDVGTLARFEAAARRLDALLDRQRIAWVEGRHLPQEVEATAGGGLRLAVAAAETTPAGPGNAPAPAVAADDAAAREEAATLDEDAGRAPLESVDAAGATPRVPAALSRRPLGSFTLVTDVRDERLLRALAAVATALPDDYASRYGARPPAAGTVLLFARREAFRAWLLAEGGGDAGVEGFARGGVAALASGDREAATEALLVHELVHLLTRGAGAAAPPPWLDEGLAEDLAMSQRDAHGHVRPGTLRAESATRRVGTTLDGRSAFEIELGGPVAALITVAHGTRPSVAELVAMPHAAFAAPTGRDTRYATAAFLVRFLLEGEDGRRAPAFRRFLAAALAGGPGDGAALAAALGEPLDALQGPFDRWLQRTATLAARTPH